jgi:DNA/RNA endonuclease YhcR with UshA esterase domain
VRFRLEDDTGSILLVLFDDVYEQVEDGDEMVEGVSVSALGRVGEFGGALEVIPPNGASVRLLAGARVAQVTPTPEPLTVTRTPGATSPLTATVTTTPTPSATPAFTATGTLAATSAPSGATSISAIDASLIGQRVAVRGQVTAVSSFSAGFRFTLNDGSGSIQLVLFDGRYREVPNQAGLNLGAQVQVEAVVVEFNGKLELQPASGEDLRIEQAGSSSIVKTRAINTLSSADIGTLTAVVGDVLRVEGFSAGVSVFVNDGSGELRVVIFSNVLNYVPNAPSLQAGARVRVVGRIDEFGGALELVPALGYDVTINP